ncbi:trypsin-like peptidase domain-containing protein [Tissierella praeacuta]|uniref:serine protease HtrA n=1 Tax=Tissierella praeacuta TaxID=43131 RepID=UPI00333FC3E0
MSDYNYYSYNRPPRKRGLFSYFIAALVGAIIGGVLSIYIAPTYLYGKILPMPDIFARQETGNINKINITPTEDISTVTAVAKKTIGSVVGITTIQEVREFFWARDTEGVGSGVIIDSNGYILTNSHVIGDGKAKSITVLVENMEKMPGKVLWYDAALDLAIVKVDAKNLQVADLGDSDSLEVGQLAIAIGNPLGLDFQRSVTSGIISGLHRSIRVDQYNIIEDLIQTDASINPGNSGGPLLNNRGEVIGLNTAKIQTGEGLGFAIPINLVKSIAEEVISKGSFSNVYIGFQGIEVDRYERETGVKLSVNGGVVIVKVLPNSPAANVDLRHTDVITKVDNQSIESMTQLRKILYKYRIGDKVILTINRGGEEIEKEITFTKF